MSLNASAFAANDCSSALERGQQLVRRLVERGEVDGAREDVVRRLAHVHVVVRVRALAGEVRDDLVGVHVRRRARAGLEDVDRELVVVLAARRPASAAARDALGEVARRAGRARAFTRAAAPLMRPEPAHDRHRYPLAGDREVVDRLGRLAAPELLRRRHHASPPVHTKSGTRCVRATHDMTAVSTLTRRHAAARRPPSPAGALALGPGVLAARARRRRDARPTARTARSAPPDANGVRAADRLQVARSIARGNEIVPGTTYRFPIQPDGQATFATPDGGWILVDELRGPRRPTAARRRSASTATGDDRRRLPDPRRARR